MQKADYEILKLFEEKEILTPKLISYFLKMKASYVGERLDFLLNKKVIKRVERGLYQLDKRNKDRAIKQEIVLSHFIEKYSPEERLRYAFNLASMMPRVE